MSGLSQKTIKAVVKSLGDAKPPVTVQRTVVREQQQMKRQRKKPKKSENPYRNGTYDRFGGGVAVTAAGGASIGAAVRNSGLRNIGHQNLMNHLVSWVSGYIYVGNGTLGTTDQIYFQPQGSTTTVVDGIVPIAGADTNVGASFIADIEKHYVRKVVHSTRLDLHSLIPATSNSMEVVLGPTRGAFGIVNTAVSNGTPLQQLYQSVLSMANAVSCSSWQDLALDLTKFIAGGYGAKQNEFVINNPISTSTDVAVIGQEAELVVPCGFAVSGQNSTTALRGTRTHAVVVTQRMDLLDFVGGEAAANPIGKMDLFAALAARRRYVSFIRDMSARASASYVDPRFDPVDVKTNRELGIPRRDDCEHRDEKQIPTLSLKTTRPSSTDEFRESASAVIDLSKVLSGSKERSTSEIVDDYVRLRATKGPKTNNSKEN